MTPQDLTVDHQLAQEPIYISSGVEGLIAVQMDAWKRGYECAGADGPAAIRDIAALQRAAEDACDEALLVYVPMDLARFRDIYMIAWCAGYCTRRQESRHPTS